MSEYELFEEKWYCTEVKLKQRFKPNCVTFKLRHTLLIIVLELFEKSVRLLIETLESDEKSM